MQNSNTEEIISVVEDEMTDEFLRYVSTDDDLWMLFEKSVSDIVQEIINSEDFCSDDSDSESEVDDKY